MSAVLFVCLGNICRSPSAEGAFRLRAARAGLTDIIVDSAGTGDWHIGSAPDRRAIDAARRRGYDISGLCARQVRREDFIRFTHILAMDRMNLTHLRSIAPRDSTARVELFLDYAEGDEREVPDPYYGGEDGFDRVLDLVEAASDGLIAELRRLQAASG